MSLKLASERVDGTPPLLVYLHGLGCAGSRDWPPVATSPALAGCASQWIDLAGFGRSPRPADFDYSIPAQAALVAALLQDCRQPIALVGHSMGGTLAILVAEALIRSGCPPAAVLLAEPNLRPQDATTSARVAAVPEADFVAGWQAFVDGIESAWYRDSVRLADPTAYHRSAVSLVEHGGRMLSRFLALPVGCKGYILGGRSDADTRETARLVAEGGVAVARVESSGHEFSADDPAGLAAVVARLLAEPDAPI